MQVIMHKPAELIGLKKKKVGKKKPDESIYSWNPPYLNKNFNYSQPKNVNNFFE